MARPEQEERDPPLIRALLVGNFLSRHGGVRGVCEELADRLEAREHQILRTSSRRGRVARMLDMTWTIRRRRADYDVAQIDLYSGSAFLWGAAAGRSLARHHKPFIVTLHGGSLPQLVRDNGDPLRSLLDRAARVTAPSPYLAREMAALRDDIEVLPNALDLSLYPFRRREAPEPKIVWLRAFHHIYRPTLAVRCFAQLLPLFPEARLTMIGPDKGDGSRAEVDALLDALAIRDKVLIEAAVPKSEVGRTLARADVFLNTSRVDNAPVTVVEAMACGLCVVSTDAGGLRDLVSDGRTGLLVPADQPQAMTDAVRRLLKDTGLAARLSEGARRDAESHDWGQILPRWERLLEETARAAA